MGLSDIGLSDMGQSDKGWSESLYELQGSLAGIPAAASGTCWRADDRVFDDWTVELAVPRLQELGVGGRHQGHGIYVRSTGRRRACPRPLGAATITASCTRRIRCRRLPCGLRRVDTVRSEVK